MHRQISRLAKAAFAAGESGVETAHAAEKSLLIKQALAASLEAEIEEIKNRLCILLGIQTGALGEKLDAVRPIPAGNGLLAVPFILNIKIIVISFLFSTLVGIIFGFFPARKAARLDPIEALRHE